MIELTATNVLLLLASGAALGVVVVLLRAMGRESDAVNAAEQRLSAATEAELALQHERLEAVRAELESIVTERDQARAKGEELSEQLTLLKVERGQLETRLDAERRHGEARIQELDNARKRMSEEFQNLPSRSRAGPASMRC